jgi:hypothetical protein
MAAQQAMMKKFEFLIGTWDLDYRVPKSAFGKAERGTGSGTFRRALRDKYVYFDYQCHLPSGDGEAHAVFVWDEKAKVYRFWWFEDSGSYMTATCSFVRPGVLFLNWHDSVLTQTFSQENGDRVVLRMNQPDSTGKPMTILKVIFTRKRLGKTP